MMDFNTLKKLADQFTIFPTSSNTNNYRINIANRLSFSIYETYQTIFQSEEGQPPFTEGELIQKYQYFLTKISNDFLLHDIHASKETQTISQLLILIAIGVSENLTKGSASLNTILKTLIHNLKVIPDPADYEKSGDFLLAPKHMEYMERMCNGNFNNQYATYAHNSQDQSQESAVNSYYDTQILRHNISESSEILPHYLPGVSDKHLTLMLKISQILNTHFIVSPEGEPLEIELMPLSLFNTHISSLDTYAKRKSTPLNPYFALMANNSERYLREKTIKAMSDSHSAISNLLAAKNKLDNLRKTPLSLYSFLYNIKNQMHEDSLIQSDDMSTKFSQNLYQELRNFCQYVSTLSKETIATIPKKILIEMIFIKMMAGYPPAEEEKYLLPTIKEHSKYHNRRYCLHSRALSIEKEIEIYQKKLTNIGVSDEDKERTFYTAKINFKKLKTIFLEKLSTPGFKREQSLKITPTLISKIIRNQTSPGDRIYIEPYALFLELNYDEISSIISTFPQSNLEEFKEGFIEKLSITSEFSQFFRDCSLDKIKFIFKLMGDSLWYHLIRAIETGTNLTTKNPPYLTILKLLDSLKNKPALFLTEHYIKYLFDNSPETIEKIKSNYLHILKPYLKSSERGRLYLFKAMLHSIPLEEKAFIYWIIKNESNLDLKNQQIESVIDHIRKNFNLYTIQTLCQFISTKVPHLKSLYKETLKNLIIDALNDIDSFSQFDRLPFIQILRLSTADDNAYFLNHIYKKWQHSEDVKLNTELFILILRDAHKHLPSNTFEKTKSNAVKSLYRKDFPSDDRTKHLPLQTYQYYNRILLKQYIENAFDFFSNSNYKSHLIKNIETLTDKLNSGDIKTFFEIILSDKKKFPISRLGGTLISLKKIIGLLGENNSNLIRDYTNDFIKNILETCKPDFQSLPSIFKAIDDDQINDIMTCILKKSTFIDGMTHINNLSMLLSHASEVQKNHLFTILSINLTPQGYLKTVSLKAKDKQLNALFYQLTPEQVEVLIQSSRDLKKHLLSSTELTPKELIKSLPSDTQCFLLSLFEPVHIIKKIFAERNTDKTRENAIVSFIDVISPELRIEYFKTLLTYQPFITLCQCSCPGLQKRLLEIDSNFQFIFKPLEDVPLPPPSQLNFSGKRISANAYLVQYSKASSATDEDTGAPRTKRTPTI